MLIAGNPFSFCQTLTGFLSVFAKIATIIAAVCVSLASAEARRVALVIGNSAYQQVPPLNNPTNDARDLAETLKSIGFSDVRYLENLDHAKLLRSLKDFQAVSAGSEIALIYFAGHGVEVNGKNYLVPIDADLKEAGDVDYEAVSLDQVRSSIARASKLRLVVLDACRNNPFRLANTGLTRSLNRGLAIVDEPSSNELIAYAARAGTVASDGGGQKNSPYATALIKALSEPGIEVRQVFGRVRDQVVSATSRSQEPFTYGTLGGESIFLNPPASQPSSTSKPPISIEAPSTASSEAATTWGVTKDSTSVAILEAFAASYPNTVYSVMAKARAEELRRIQSQRLDEDSKSKKAAATSSSAAGNLALATPPASLLVPNPSAASSVPEIVRPARKLDDQSFVRSLQGELRRVGCDPGEIDGKWGKKAQSALEQFAKLRKISLRSEDVDEAILKLVSLEQERVCPLICDEDEVESGGRCLPKAQSAPSVKKPEPKFEASERNRSNDRKSSCDSPAGKGGDCPVAWMQLGRRCTDACGRSCIQEPYGRYCR